MVKGRTEGSSMALQEPQEIAMRLAASGWLAVVTSRISNHSSWYNVTSLWLVFLLLILWRICIFSLFFFNCYLCCFMTIEEYLLIASVKLICNCLWIELLTEAFIKAVWEKWKCKVYEEFVQKGCSWNVETKHFRIDTNMIETRKTTNMSSSYHESLKSKNEKCLKKIYVQEKI